MSRLLISSLNNWFKQKFSNLSIKRSYYQQFSHNLDKANRNVFKNMRKRSKITSQPANQPKRISPYGYWLPFNVCYVYHLITETLWFCHSKKTRSEIYAGMSYRTNHIHAITPSSIMKYHHRVTYTRRSLINFKPEINVQSKSSYQRTYFKDSGKGEQTQLKFHDLCTVCSLVYRMWEGTDWAKIVWFHTPHI